MRDTFHTAIEIRDVLGGEAKWVGVLTVDGKRIESEKKDTHAQAERWLTDQVAAFLAEPVVLPAPDGDGVVVGAALEQRVVFQAPSVAVHVGSQSPMVSDPVTAAKIATRVHYARLLVEEAGDLAMDTVIVDLPSTTYYEGILWGLEDALRMFLKTFGCVVLAQEPAVHTADPEQLGHLTVVPDVDAGAVAP